MAANNPRKPKAKTEEKAKGLIGLKKGEKVKGAPYSVGNYKGKTLNLSKKELGKAGQAAAAKRTVKIQDTKYEGKKVLGPGGKPLTGTVDLGGGNMAVYKNGVRVRAQKPKPPAGGGRGGSTGGGGRNMPTGTTGSDTTTGGRTKPPKVGETRRGPNGRLNRWDGKKWVSTAVSTTGAANPRAVSAARRGEAAAARTGTTYQSGRPGASAYAASVVRGTGQAPSRPSTTGRGSSTTRSSSANANIPFAGNKKPTGKEIGPGVLGVRNPRDGGQYRFGSPGNMSVYRWDAKAKKFVYVRKA